MVEEHGLRRPAATYRAAIVVVANDKKAKMSQFDRYTVAEQLCVASLDLNDVKRARSLVDQLYVSFPASVRVGKLEGMCLEAEGRFEEAITKYDELLERSPAEQRVMKRKAAAYKAQGRVTEAIDTLTTYLDTFMGDFDAWEELAGNTGADDDPDGEGQEEQPRGERRVSPDPLEEVRQEQEHREQSDAHEEGGEIGASAVSVGQNPDRQQWVR
jgi:predicted Zn-dependent protease